LRSPIASALQDRRIAIPLSDPTLFTDAPNWQRYISEDPPTLREITLRFAREDGALTRFARGSAAQLTMPLLMMLAGQDRIIDNRRVREFYDRTPSTRKTLIEYPEARHTLEFEPDPPQYLTDLTGWIDRVASGLGAR
jgi:alpha-beta hydrolase superfamily lysophospholipase